MAATPDAGVAAMSSHVWYYRTDPALAAPETIGPLTEAEMVALAGAGTLKRDTCVASPSRTGGQWVTVQQVPGLMQAFDQGEKERREHQERIAAERRRKVAEEAAIRAEERADANAVAAREKQELLAISHCQNLSLVRSLRDKVRPILTSSESITYVAVQQKPLINISPDAIIATNRRMIFFRAKILGRFEFQDFMWFDVFNAHIQQNLLGAMFTCQHTSGTLLTMDYLSRESAHALYRLAQENEEKARLARHNLHLDTLRAGATNITVGQSTPVSSPHSTPVSPGAIASDDLVKRLETLKAMLDKGLISQEDYDRRKQEVLAQI